jgi:hypothetical protein
MARGEDCAACACCGPKNPGAVGYMLSLTCDRVLASWASHLGSGQSETFTYHYHCDFRLPSDPTRPSLQPQYQQGYGLDTGNFMPLNFSQETW